MKRIGLLDVDGHNYPNLALMKISMIVNADRLVLEQKITTKSFRNLSIEHMLRLSRHMKEALYHGPDIDFNTYPSYGQALKILTKKLCDADIITEAICKDNQP